MVPGPAERHRQGPAAPRSGILELGPQHDGHRSVRYRCSLVSMLSSMEVQSRALGGQAAGSGAEAPQAMEVVAGPVTDRLDLGGVTLALRRYSPATPCVVLLHGLASNARIWDAVGTALAARRVPAVAVDQRGHGGSSRPADGYDLATAVGDLDAALEAVGAVRPVVVGHSFGAHVALQQGAEGHYPTGGLLGIDGGFLDWRATPGLTADLAEERLAPNAWAMPLAEWRQAPWLPTEIDPETPWIRAFLDGSVLAGPDGLVRPRLATAAHAALARSLVEQHPEVLVARLAVPFQFCLATREDLPIPKAPGFDRLRRRFPAGRYCIHEDGAHDLPLTEPERLAEEITDFVLRASVAGIPGRAVSPGADRSRTLSCAETGSAPTLSCNP